jgi:hypothetical protein
MVLHQPLEIEYWFSQVFSGTPLIFTLLMVSFVTYLAARFRMETSSYLVMLVLFATIMFARGDNAFMVLIVLILSPLLFVIIRRLVE